MTPLLLALALAAPPKLTVAHEKADLPADVAEPLRKLFPAECERLTGDGDTIAEFWFRAAWPTTATAEQAKNGLTYRELTEGGLLGVARFAKAFTDYRKQEIPAGVYTLRLAIQPDVGDHKETAPHTEFLLLSPSAKDISEDALDAKALQKLSATLTGGDHPAVMLLFPHTGQPGDAKLATQKDGATTLNVVRPVVVGDVKATFGLAVVVAGHSAKR